MSDELKQRVLVWCKSNDGGRLHAKLAPSTQSFYGERTYTDDGAES